MFRARLTGGTFYRRRPLLHWGAAAAAAQAPEIRFARQFSMGYLQFNLMEKHQLLEKHAKAAGIPRSRWCGPPSTARRP
jgi:hypothetical protein